MMAMLRLHASMLENLRIGRIKMMGMANTLLLLLGIMQFVTLSSAEPEVYYCSGTQTILRFMGKNVTYDEASKICNGNWILPNKLSANCVHMFSSNLERVNYNQSLGGHSWINITSTYPQHMVSSNVSSGMAPHPPTVPVNNLICETKPAVSVCTTSQMILAIMGTKASYKAAENRCNGIWKVPGLQSAHCVYTFSLQLEQMYYGQNHGGHSWIYDDIHQRPLVSTNTAYGVTTQDLNLPVKILICEKEPEVYYCSGAHTILRFMGNVVTYDQASRRCNGNWTLPNQLSAACVHLFSSKLEIMYYNQYHGGHSWINTPGPIAYKKVSGPYGVEERKYTAPMNILICEAQQAVSVCSPSQMTLAIMGTNASYKDAKIQCNGIWKVPGPMSADCVRAFSSQLEQMYYGQNHGGHSWIYDDIHQKFLVSGNSASGMITKSLDFHVNILICEKELDEYYCDGAQTMLRFMGTRVTYLKATERCDGHWPLPNKESAKCLHMFSSKLEKMYYKQYYGGHSWINTPDPHMVSASTPSGMEIHKISQPVHILICEKRSQQTDYFCAATQTMLRFKGKFFNYDDAAKGCNGNWNLPKPSAAHCVYEFSSQLERKHFKKDYGGHSWINSDNLGRHTVSASKVVNTLGMVLGLATQPARIYICEEKPLEYFCNSSQVKLKLMGFNVNYTAAKKRCNGIWKVPGVLSTHCVHSFSLELELRQYHHNHGGHSWIYDDINGRPLVSTSTERSQSGMGWRPLGAPVLILICEQAQGYSTFQCADDKKNSLVYFTGVRMNHLNAFQHCQKHGMELPEGGACAKNLARTLSSGLWSRWVDTPRIARNVNGVSMDGSSISLPVVCAKGPPSSTFSCTFDEMKKLHPIRSALDGFAFQSVTLYHFVTSAQSYKTAGQICTQYGMSLPDRMYQLCVSKFMGSVTSYISQLFLPNAWLLQSGYDHDYAYGSNMKTYKKGNRLYVICAKGNPSGVSSTCKGTHGGTMVYIQGEDADYALVRKQCRDLDMYVPPEGVFDCARNFGFAILRAVWTTKMSSPGHYVATDNFPYGVYGQKLPVVCYKPPEHRCYTTLVRLFPNPVKNGQLSGPTYDDAVNACKEYRMKLPDFNCASNFVATSMKTDTWSIWIPPDRGLTMYGLKDKFYVISYNHKRSDKSSLLICGN